MTTKTWGPDAGPFAGLPRDNDHDMPTPGEAAAALRARLRRLDMAEDELVDDGESYSIDTDLSEGR
jgi:hypothetical protein